MPFGACSTTTRAISAATQFPKMCETAFQLDGLGSRSDASRLNWGRAEPFKANSQTDKLFAEMESVHSRTGFAAKPYP